ncbi:MAG: NAD(P)/FAD-dependent oxidoreductase, partial [Candidatus Hodgkinia cicadicola]
TESVQTPSSSDEVALPTPQRLVERLAIFGSGLAGYSAAVGSCSSGTSPLLITGPVLGGTLASPGTIEYWPGAAPNAKSSDLAAALHAQAAHLGTKFMYDSVQSIDTTTQPFTITTKQGGLLFASAIIVATGLSAKTLNLKDEVSLLGRSVFTSAATISGPHKDAAVVGNDCAAINEALELSTMVSQVTLVCGAPQLTCPPSLATKLSQTANIRVEYNATVSSYATSESDGGHYLWGLNLKRSDKLFTIKVTVAVLALGFEPKVDLLPQEAKTAEGFIKSNLSSLNLKGIFAAGTIVESTPDQQIMLSASGFTAATSAVQYLASPEAKLAVAQYEFEKTLQHESAEVATALIADGVNRFKALSQRELGTPSQNITSVKPSDASATESPNTSAEPSKVEDRSSSKRDAHASKRSSSEADKLPPSKA